MKQTSIGIIAGRELTTSLFSKASIIGNLIMIVIIIGAGVAFKLFMPAEEPTVIGFEKDAISLEPAVTTVSNTLNISVEHLWLEETDENDMLADGTIDALLSLEDGKLVVTVQEELSEELKLIFTAIAQQQALEEEILNLGGDPAQLAIALANAEPEILVLDPPEDVSPQGYISSLVIGALLFFAVYSAGMMVAQGVVEEKTSRVVELIVSTVKPWQLLLGKIFGIGIAALINVLVLAAVTIATLHFFVGVNIFEIGLTSTLWWSLAWFILGFFNFALIFAGLGALVSRQEDLGSVITIPTILLMAGYMATIAVIPNNPEATLGIVLSYFPGTAPLTAPVTYNFGTLSNTEMVLSFGISILTSLLLLWLCSKIYSNAILRTGKKVKLSEALRK